MGESEARKFGVANSESIEFKIMKDFLKIDIARKSHQKSASAILENPRMSRLIMRVKIGSLEVKTGEQ